MSLSSNYGFETTSDIDHRSWVWVAGILALVYSVLCLAARATGKWGLLWYDDGILVGAYVAAVLHWGLLYRSLVDGLAVSPVAITAGQLGDAARVCTTFIHLPGASAAHLRGVVCTLVKGQGSVSGNRLPENRSLAMPYQDSAVQWCVCQTGRCVGDIWSHPHSEVAARTRKRLASRHADRMLPRLLQHQ